MNSILSESDQFLSRLISSGEKWIYGCPGTPIFGVVPLGQSVYFINYRLRSLSPFGQQNLVAIQISQAGKLATGGLRRNVAIRQRPGTFVGQNTPHGDFMIVIGSTDG